MKSNIRYFQISILIILSALLISCDIGSEKKPKSTEANPSLEATSAEGDDGTPLTEETATEPTVTPVATVEISEISFYHLGNLSGSGAEYTTPWITAFEDMVLALNDEDGIEDVEVTLYFEDTKGDVEKAIEVYQTWVAEDPSLPFVVVYDAITLDALLPLAQADNISILSPTVSNSNANTMPDYFYGFGVSYETQFNYFLRYLAENWDNVKPKGAEDQIYLAYLGWEGNEDFQGLTDETRVLAESLNIIIQREAYFFDSPTESMSNQVMRAQWAASNFIYGNFHSHGGAILVNDIYRLGLHLIFGVGVPYQAFDLNTYAYLGYDGYFDKVYSPFPMQWWTDSNAPAMDTQLDLIESQGGSMLLDTNQARLSMAGITQVITVAMQNIIEDGTIEISGETFDDAINQLSSDDIEDPIFHFDYSQDSAELSQLQIRRVLERLNFEIIDGFSPIED